MWRNLQLARMKLQDVESTILLLNNIPQDDFCGLTPSEVHHILYYPYGKESPLQFQKNIDDSVLDGIPFFRLTEEFLKILQRDKRIKLTPLGALPKKVMVELYSHGFILEEYIESGIVKLTREHDCISISSVAIVSRLAGLIKMQYGRYFLTKAGEKFMLPNNRVRFFKKVFQTFTEKFDWSLNDGYPQDIAQLGWAYSVLVLNKFGDQERTLDFYARLYSKAFPILTKYFLNAQYAYSTPEIMLNRCYEIRTFERFLEWFGLVKIQRISTLIPSDRDIINRSGLIKRLFIFD